MKPATLIRIWSGWYACPMIAIIAWLVVGMGYCYFGNWERSFICFTAALWMALLLRDLQDSKEYIKNYEETVDIIMSKAISRKHYNRVYDEIMARMRKVYYEA